MNLTDINEIHALLSRHGFRFSKSMGQNFLTQAWVPEDIAEGARLDRSVGVLEVGPGIGCLTEKLSQRAGKVVCVELDNALRPVLRETLAGCDNVEVVFGDVLKQDLRALVSERLAPLRPVVCANLPYNVTSPLLTAFLEAGVFESITVMIQKEVAERICAKPGTADYGAFGVFVQWHCETEKLFDVPAHCFVPQPKVTSSVIRLVRRKCPPCAVQDEKLLFRVVRAAFNQRRKTLLNALTTHFPELGKEELAGCIERAGLDVRVRGEVLSIAQFAAVSDGISLAKN